MRILIVGMIAGVAVLLLVLFRSRDSTVDLAVSPRAEGKSELSPSPSIDTLPDRPPEPAGNREAEVIRENPPAGSSAMDPDLALALETTDESVRYRANQRFVLRRAIDRFKTTPANEGTRYQNIILLSIATILDRSGNYVVPEDGVRFEVDMRDGFYHFSAQGRHYKIRPGEFPEYDEWSRWGLACSKWEDQAEKSGRPAEPRPVFDAAFEAVILARAEEALELVSAR